MKPIRLIKGFLTVGLWTLMSRIMGFARDIIIASRLGDGPIAEAFVVAFTLPNMFRRFFAEGAFNLAFIPIFSKKLEADDDPLTFARDAFAGLAGVLIVLTLLAQLVMPWMVLAMASGFAEDERLDLAVTFGRICFPYILFISLAALLSGVLNATGRFAAAAAAPVLLNVVLVAAMLLAVQMGWDFGLTLSWAVPMAGIAQMVLVWIAASRAGFRLLPRWPHMTPELKRLAIIAAPAALSGGVLQVNLLVSRQVASYYDGAIQYLNLADRLYQLPLGVVAIAIGVVLLPDLSRRIQAGDEAGGKDALNRAAEFALFLTLPAAVALVLVAAPITSVLYQRGAFGSEAAAATALATSAYGLGLPAFVLQKVLQPLFYARHDTRRPMNYALLTIGVNAAAAIGFSYLFGFVGAALGTTLAAWAMVVLLWFGSRNMGDAARPDSRLLSRLPRMVASAAIMGGVLLAANWLLADALATPGLRYIALLGLVTAGIVSYFTAAELTGAMRIAELKASLRRRKA